jgi:hypothetical protein
MDQPRTFGAIGKTPIQKASVEQQAAMNTRSANPRSDFLIYPPSIWDEQCE